MPADLRKEQQDLPAERQRCALKGNTIDTSSAVAGAGTAVSKAGGRSPPGPGLERQREWEFQGITQENHMHVMQPISKVA